MFTSKELLQLHNAQEHSTGESFKCQTCNKNFSRARDLNFHCRVVHRRCRVCDANIGVDKAGNKHMSTHPFCKMCCIVSDPGPSTLREGSNSHPKGLTSQFFPSSALLDQHNAREHDSTGSSHCRRCNKTFAVPRDLGTHCIKEHGCCRICDTEIGHGKDAFRHMSTHPGCVICYTARIPTHTTAQ